MSFDPEEVQIPFRRNPTDLLVSTSVPSPAQEPSSFDLEGPRIAVYNLARTVEVVRDDGPAVRVEVRKRGPDASRLDVAVDRIGGRESLRVLYPGDRIVYPEIGRSRIDIDVADDGTFLGGDRGWRLGWWSDDVEIRGSGRGLGAGGGRERRVRQRSSHGAGDPEARLRVRPPGRRSWTHPGGHGERWVRIRGS